MLRNFPDILGPLSCGSQKFPQSSHQIPRKTRCKTSRQIHRRASAGTQGEVLGDNPSFLSNLNFRGPQMGGWIRCGWIWRFWGAPIFCSEVPNPLKIGIWHLWTENRGAGPKTPNQTTTDPTPHLRSSENFFRVAHLQKEVGANDFLGGTNFLTKNAPKFSPIISGVAPANQTKERPFRELFQGAFRNKSSM